MLSAFAPIWDGNETWLVVTAVILWGAFSCRLCHVAVGILSPSHYYAAGPDLARCGVRVSLQDQRLRWIWDLSFAGGSLIATFIQGMTVGALVHGLQITNGEYSGGEVGWLTPFAVLWRHRPVPWFMRSSARAGWSENATPRSATSHAARSPCSRLRTGLLVLVFAYALAEAPSDLNR